MVKKLLFAAIVSSLFLGMKAQSINDAFFTKVSYIGAFGADDWTRGWANFDPQNTVYPVTTSTLGNGELSQAGGLKITKDTTISGVIQLNGWIYVQNGATLTIEAGTVIRGEAAAALVVERGGKLNAEGTVDKPIVFTSGKPEGSRNTNDWAGVILCGKATNNKGTDVIIEGGVGATYGAGNGAVENDNSGILKYVRIEFPGYDIDGKGNEINGLTMGSVGSGTTIEYVQVSYSGDDAYEWFGGTVNCKHLIAYATEDDDFDTDFGYRGMVQFITSVRNPKICDTDGARGFESDNDGNSSYHIPYTSAVFSNVSLFGPSVDESATQKHDMALLLRRNTRLQIYNLLATGYVKGGLKIDGDVTQKAAAEDSMGIHNSIFAGNTPFIFTGGTSNPLTDAKAWFMSAVKSNDTISNVADLKITFPLTITDPNFLPASGSPLLLKGSAFGKAVSAITVNSANDITTIEKGASLQLSSVVAPANALSSKVQWEIVSGSELASINQDGLLTSKGVGMVTVKVSATDASGIATTKDITIGNAVALVKVFANGGAITMENKASLQLKAALTPTDAVVTNVSWSITTGAELAEISKNGLLTAKGEGQVTVKATSASLSGVSGTLTVKILKQGAYANTINDPFFTRVSYIGAFGSDDWTKGWANFTPQLTEYATTTSVLGNGELSMAGGLKITKDTTIKGSIQLTGWVYVQSGATLTIEKGTVIRGEAAAALVVERGGKLMAEGTVDMPVVFTSNKPAGSRNTNDWAGVIICGKSTNNHGTDVIIEGGVGATYGGGLGSVEDDNSGVLKYVRIEFPGYDIDGKGNEINGLTLGSVGSATTIDYVQVSYSGDDAFEWFGGTVNCKHLIALATEDDDFDTDFGYRGKVQFALSVRDPKICDTDGARGFESDNDANSSYNYPYTNAIFSNVSLLGPIADSSVTNKHDVAMLLRRNTRLQIYNTLGAGYVKGGVKIDGDVTQKAATDDSLIIMNTILSGQAPLALATGKANPMADVKAWFMAPAKANDTISELANLKIQFPVVRTAPVFIPEAGSPLLSRGNVWGLAVANIAIVAAGTKDTITTDETLQLTATVKPVNAVKLETIWSIMSGEGVATVSESGLVSAIKPGTVVIKAVSTDGSGIYGTYKLEIVVGTTINDMRKATSNTVNIYPNPAFDQFTATSVNTMATVEVYSISGMLVHRIENINASSVQVNINGIRAGVYMVNIRTANGVQSRKKLIVK